MRARTSLAPIAAIWMTCLAGCAESRVQGPHLLDLEGRQAHPLQDARAKAVVFLFVRTDCPISNRYAPEVRRLHERFGHDGVAFWLVYPDPDESSEAIRGHIKDYEYGIDALRDPQHSLVRMTGARVTPEAAVFVPGPSGMQRVYRGRIDDRYVDFGRMRPEPTTHDLETVLEMIVAGRRVQVREIAAIGCFIPDLP